jgi:hypothetical protein
MSKLKNFLIPPFLMVALFFSSNIFSSETTDNKKNQDYHRYVEEIVFEISDNQLRGRIFITGGLQFAIDLVDSETSSFVEEIQIGDEAQLQTYRVYDGRYILYISSHDSDKWVPFVKFFDTDAVDAPVVEKIEMSEGIDPYEPITGIEVFLSDGTSWEVSNANYKDNDPHLEWKAGDRIVVTVPFTNEKDDDLKTAYYLVNLDAPKRNSSLYSVKVIYEKD